MQTPPFYKAVLLAIIPRRREKFLLLRVRREFDGNFAGQEGKNMLCYQHKRILWQRRRIALFSVCVRKYCYTVFYV